MFEFIGFAGVAYLVGAGVAKFGNPAGNPWYWPLVLLRKAYAKVKGDE